MDKLRKKQGSPAAEKPAADKPKFTRTSKRYDTRLTDCALGSIVDLSTEGARIVAHSEPAVKRGHVFEISLTCGDVKIFVLARVAWTSQVQKNVWNIGLHFFDADAQTRADVERLLDAAAAGREILPTSVEIEDLYATLGVAPSATGEEIRAAYRRLARKYHPDYAPDQEASRMFARISKCYMVLRDESLRRRYDELRNAA
ncbi:MAG: DnaJ domain-containing protein [Phycisphaerales bacterium]|nr:DnaJ domain-containing protein [Phycisphaerales bacterium]